MKEPVKGRRPRGYQSIASKGRIYVVEPVAEDGLAFFEAAKENGLGGVVAKRFDSPYRAGQRHPDWLLIEAVRREDFAVIGFIPQAGDHPLEALIVATYDGRRFQPAGRVGGGFHAVASRRMRKALRALPNASPPGARRWSDGRSRRTVPRLVCAAKFTDCGPNGQ